jgi:hypothetical protein
MFVCLFEHNRIDLFLSDMHCTCISLDWVFLGSTSKALEPFVDKKSYVCCHDMVLDTVGIQSKACFSKQKEG